LMISGFYWYSFIHKVTPRATTKTKTQALGSRLGSLR
jgi:hypothetical protein